MRCKSAPDYRVLLGLNWEHAEQLLNQWSVPYETEVVSVDRPSPYQLDETRKVVCWTQYDEKTKTVRVLLSTPQRETEEIRCARRRPRE